VRGLHVLSDFDGVWTDPERELDAVRAEVLRRLAKLSAWPVERVGRLYDRLAGRARSEPEVHGWRIGGELTSYLDEDFFGLPAAVGEILARGEDEETAELRDAVLAAWPAVSAFFDACYHETCAWFRRRYPHDLTRGAGRLLDWLAREGVRVTFATNAPAEKVQAWFAEHGLRVDDARETEAGSRPLRVYGRAGKQWLGEEPCRRRFGGRPVRVDRPRYRAILEREQPDLVLGDVLSLDLALPLHLRAEGREEAPRRAVLVERPETPDWVRAAAGPGLDRLDALVPHVTSLPRMLQGLRPRAPA